MMAIIILKRSIATFSEPSYKSYPGSSFFSYFIRSIDPKKALMKGETIQHKRLRPNANNKAVKQANDAVGGKFTLMNTKMEDSCTMYIIQKSKIHRRAVHQ